VRKYIFLAKYQYLNGRYLDMGCAETKKAFFKNEKSLNTFQEL
jgi:hypothetical protein